MTAAVWICVRPVLTACGWVAPGRVVPDGDPMLDGNEDAFKQQLHTAASPPAPVPPTGTVEEAGGGSARARTGRRKADT